MCGIFGYYCFALSKADQDVMPRMAEAIKHRGPDATGYEIDDRAALGNTRLSIVDLTVKSNQPVISDNGDIVLVQNGEIYNYIELREELTRKGKHFKTSGDTEVLLRAYETWGPEFVSRLNGMFAIAIHDRRSNKLWLYRDRLGVKPLFYYHDTARKKLWFSSEIKALLEAGIPAKPNYDALAQYLALNYIPQPSTAFDGVSQVPPAHSAEITPSGIQIKRYWDLADIKVETHMSQAEAKAGLLTLLDDATRLRMRADAKFGAFLSGGLDSSSVVGFMSTFQKEPIRTFSIGFTDSQFDETSYAHKASHRFGTLHEVQYSEPETVRLWPRFIWHTEQPHGDVSFMPMDQVSSMAAREVKMVLTGDGGDELFAGYDKYAAFFNNHPQNDLTDGWVDDYVKSTGLLNGNEADILLTGDLRHAFHEMDPYRALRSEIERADHQDPINQVLFSETTTLLPGNNLVKPDRMAMANSLEVRSPFLDYRMAEFAFSMPGSLKLAGGETKAIYKEAVLPLLGRELTYRKKQMFTVPVGEWLRSTTNDYCHKLLLDGRLGARGMVDGQTIIAMLNDHIQGTANYTRQLRALISLEIWFRIFIDKDPYWLEAATFKPELNNYVS